MEKRRRKAPCLSKSEAIAPIRAHSKNIVPQCFALCSLFLGGYKQQCPRFIVAFQNDNFRSGGTTVDYSDKTINNNHGVVVIYCFVDMLRSVVWKRVFCWYTLVKQGILSLSKDDYALLNPVKCILIFFNKKLKCYDLKSICTA